MGNLYLSVYKQNRLFLLQRLFVLICLVVSSLTVLAQESASSKSMIISYSNDQNVIQTWIPLLKRTYQKLGMSVEFVEVGIKRGLIGVNSGVFDGDVARMAIAPAHYPDIILVRPKLTQIDVRLNCRLGVICSSKVFDKIDVLIGLPISSPAHELLFKDMKALTQNIRGQEQAFEMYEKKRFDYFVWVVPVNAQIMAQPETPLQSISLKKMDMHHVLHKKHQEFAERLGKELAIILASSEF